MYLNKALILLFIAALPQLVGAQDFTRKTFNYDSLPSEDFTSCNDGLLAELEYCFQAISNNNSDLAVQKSKPLFEANKDCYQSYEVYGFSLFRNGKWYEGLDIIEQGIETFGSVPELIKRRSSMSIEMAQLGPGRKNIDGSTVFKANSEEYDEDQFMTANFESALTDLEYLMENYNRDEETYLVAKIYQLLEQYDRSTLTFERLRDNEEYGLDAVFNIADNYLNSDQFDKAEKELILLLSEYPEDGEILGKLADVYGEKGDEEKADEYHEKAVFYKNMPDFSDLSYSEENFETLVLFGTDNATPKEKREGLKKIQKEKDEAYTIDVCLMILNLHMNHGNGVEELATEILGEIGKPSIEKVHLLFQQDVSTCTITNLADVMATVKEESSWELLKTFLPYIANMPMTLIPPNVPQKMIDFDEKRGLIEILTVVQPLLEPKSEDDSDGMAGLRGFGQYVYYMPLKDLKQSKVIKAAKKLGYSDQEIELLKKKLD